jgi:hypothetical protein
MVIQMRAVDDEVLVLDHFDDGRPAVITEVVPLKRLRNRQVYVTYAYRVEFEDGTNKVVGQGHLRSKVEAI